MISLIVISVISAAFIGSMIVFVEERNPASFIQLLGAGCLIVVVLAHVAELFHLFPFMGWGLPDSAGHYLDLSSAVAGLILLPIGYVSRGFSSPSAWGWLLRKEWRELTTSRSFWVMLVLMGPLVGVSFINAVRSYAEASGKGGAGAGLADALFPLDGVVAPTFSAYEIAASFLLPFVAIRAIGGDRASGTLKLELQQGVAPLSMIGAKALVLGTGWLLAGVPIALAGILWISYGGSLYAPEVASLVIGHLLNAGLVIAVAAAAAALAEHPSTAAILVLAFTVGTWVLGFVATFQGGIWEQIVSYTPSEILQTFRRGLVRLDLMLVALALIVAALVMAASWIRLGVPVRRRALESVAIIGVVAALSFGVSFVRLSWDISENERNSFDEADEALLERIVAPLKIEVHLAAEDPRRFDLEHQTLAKLRRTMHHLRIEYVASSSTGLFEQADAHYGEIWYDLGGKRTVGQSATADGVLDAIYELAGMQPPQEGEAGHRGHPLAVEPTGAAVLFYVIWPLAVIGLGFLLHRRRLT